MNPKIEFLSHGFSHKLHLVLIQKNEDEKWSLNCEGTMRFGFISSSIQLRSFYSLNNNQKKLETAQLEAPKFRILENYQRNSSDKFVYNKNSSRVVIKDVPQNVLDPLALICEMVSEGENDPECLDGTSFTVLVGGKVRDINLKRSSLGYIALIKGKEIFSVQNHKDGVVVQILVLPFQPEVQVKF